MRLCRATVRHDRQDHRVARYCTQLRPPPQGLEKIVAGTGGGVRIGRKYDREPRLGEALDLLRRQVDQRRDREFRSTERIVDKAGDARGDKQAKLLIAQCKPDDLINH
jgi:hypothetical protein